MLDEPSASLPATDVQRLFDVLRELRRQGVGMIYDLAPARRVMQLSDRAPSCATAGWSGVRTARPARPSWWS